MISFVLTIGFVSDWELYPCVSVKYLEKLSQSLSSDTEHNCCIHQSS